jgi:DNA-directed RNA polymerase specialized sigma24 family protein
MNTTTTTSRDECVSNDIALRNECIMVAMKRAEAMLRSYAFTYDLDFDDLYQDCAEMMLRVQSRMPETVSPVPYLFGVARIEMRRIVTRINKENLHPISLDEPLYDGDGAETVADTIPDTRQAQDDTGVDHIIETIHEALHECMYEEQVHVKEYYELNAFVPAFHTNRRTGHTPFSANRKPHNIRDSVKRVLRKQPHVQALVQRETCAM